MKYIRAKNRVNDNRKRKRQAIREHLGLGNESCTEEIVDLFTSFDMDIPNHLGVETEEPDVQTKALNQMMHNNPNETLSMLDKAILAPKPSKPKLQTERRKNEPILEYVKRMRKLMK